MICRCVVDMTGFRKPRAVSTSPSDSTAVATVSSPAAGAQEQPKPSTDEEAASNGPSNSAEDEKDRAEAKRERERLFGAAAGSDSDQVLWGLLDRALTQSLAIDEVLAIHKQPQTHAGLPPPPLGYVFSWMGRQHAVAPIPRLLLTPLNPNTRAFAVSKK